MLGRELKDFGRVYDGKELMVVHHGLKRGDKIQPHNHVGQLIFFTVVEGELEVFLNGEERHLMQPGAVLHFDGENTISANALADSQVFVYLINKQD